MEFTNYLNTLPISKHSKQSYLSDIKLFNSWLATIGKTPTHKYANEYLRSLKKDGMKISTIKRKTMSLKHYAYFLKETNTLPANFMSKSNYPLSYYLLVFSFFAIPTIISLTLLYAMSQTTTANQEKHFFANIAHKNTLPTNKGIKLSLYQSSNAPTAKNTETNHTAELTSSSNTSYMPADYDIQFDWNKIQ